MTDNETAIDNLAHWVEVLHEAKAEIAAQEERIAVAREKIEAALGDAETGTVGGEPVVRWTHVTSRRFDQTLAKARIPGDLLVQCYTESTSRRFALVDPS